MKLKGRHFDTVEVVQAETQVAVYILREHDFQDEFKKMSEVLGTMHTCGRGVLQE
jgi:hypothetical protein